MIKKYWKPALLVVMVVVLAYAGCYISDYIDWKQSETQRKIKKSQEKITELEGKCGELAKLNTELMNDKNQIAKENQILAKKLREEIA